MSAPIPTQEPVQITAGTKVQWTKDLPDYSYADGWRLSYFLRGPTLLDIATTADTNGKTFAVTISAADTTTLTPGDYAMVGVVTNGTDSREVFRASILVLNNFSTLPAGYDPRTFARIMLDALQRARQDASGNMIAEYEIYGERRVKMFETDALLKGEYSFWENKVNEEKRQEALNRGERPGIRFRFTNAR